MDVLKQSERVIFQKLSSESVRSDHAFLQQLILHRMDLVESLFTSDDPLHKKNLNHTALIKAGINLLKESSHPNVLALAAIIHRMPRSFWDHGHHEEHANAELFRVWPSIRDHRPQACAFFDTLNKRRPATSLLPILSRFPSDSSTLLLDVVLSGRPPIETQKVFRAAVFAAREGIALHLLPTVPLALATRMTARPDVPARMPRLVAAVTARVQRTSLQSEANQPPTRSPPRSF